MRLAPAIAASGVDAGSLLLWVLAFLALIGAAVVVARRLRD